jgi:hypothetical protein
MEKIKKHLYFVVIGLIFVLALELRVKTYLFGRIFWHDECSLAANILTRGFLGFFQPLQYDQKAPAIFMMLNKAISYFGISELHLKIVSFISGLASVILFYFLSEKVLKSKFSIVIVNFLFAINYQLIYWSQKLKQYSLDVVLYLAGILLFSKLDLNKISYKKCLLFSFVSLLLILTSFPCAFVVGAYIVYCLLNKVDIKKISCFALPLALTALVYYLVFLNPSQKSWVAVYYKYWGSGFLNFSIAGIATIFKENFNFFFTPNNFVLFGVILFIFGLVLFIKNQNKTVSIILLSFPFLILASVMQIYPIWQRAALYLLPISLLFMVKPLDLVSKNKKMKAFVIIALLSLCFSKYGFFYINSFLKPDIFLKTDGLATFPKLVERFDNKADILVINTTTKADFVYYSAIYKFRPKNIVIIPIAQYDEKYYHNLLNSLPKRRDYWFIYGWEYSHRKDDLKNNILHHLQTYIQQKHLKVLEEYENNNSVLIKVKF